jgi:hypothetical protein
VWSPVKSVNVMTMKGTITAPVITDNITDNITDTSYMIPMVNYRQAMERLESHGKPHHTRLVRGTKPAWLDRMSACRSWIHISERLHRPFSLICWSSWHLGRLLCSTVSSAPWGQPKQGGKEYGKDMKRQHRQLQIRNGWCKQD